LRVACVDVRYVDGVAKSPSGGLVSFSMTDFKPANMDSRKRLPDGTYEKVFDPAAKPPATNGCVDKSNEVPPNQDAGSP
jgi:hypothetical protein